MDVDAAKRIIRRRAHRLRNAIGSEERSRAEAAIAGSLVELPELTSARVVLAYMPIRSEVGLEAVMADLHARGVLLTFPRVEEDATLSIRPHAEGDPLVVGSKGVPEPATPPLEWHEIDVALVPGVAFDRAGNRLGYGGGFFDRALDGYEGPKIGVGFQCQIVDEIPTAPHDVPMDAVVTEEGVYRR